MDPVSIVGIVGATAATISAFRDGLELFKSWRRKRKATRLARVAQFERYLECGSTEQVTQVEQSLQRNPPEIEQQHREYVSQLGTRFEMGDGEFAEKVHAYDQADRFLDTSNDSLGRIVEKFSRTITAILTGSVDPNFKHLFEVSETARQDALNTMLELCQRLHESALIRHMQPVDKDKLSTTTDIPPSSTISHNYSHTSDNLRDILDRIPKVNLSITSSDLQLTASQPVRTHQLLLDQKPRDPKNVTNNSFGHSTWRREADQPTPTPTITQPALTRSPSLASDLVYSQPPSRTLQDKLDAITQSRLGYTRAFRIRSPPSFLREDARSVPRPTAQLPQPPPLSAKRQIAAWAESLESADSESLDSESSDTASRGFKEFQGMWGRC